jgi:hypothetical protein
MRRLQIHLMLAMSALWFVAVSAIAADTPSSDRTLDWQQTETMLTLMHGDRMVWQHVHDRRVGKPFMRIGLLDGTELTRPWPIPDDYPKRDHTWHRALWWSWKWIDGVNYWEQHQEGTEPVDVRVQALDDHSAKIVLTIHYHQPDRPPVVKETRTISVSPPTMAAITMSIGPPSSLRPAISRWCSGRTATAAWRSGFPPYVAGTAAPGDRPGSSATTRDARTRRTIGRPAGWHTAARRLRSVRQPWRFSITRRTPGIQPSGSCGINTPTSIRR